MLNRFPRLSAKKVIRTLERMGFDQIRQRGSHVILKRSTPQGSVGCVVPLHSELALGTLKGVLRQAKVSLDDFVKVL